MYPDTPATDNAERYVTKLTKRHLAKLFWILLVPFLFPSALAAEPSLAETVQYIEAKLVAQDKGLTNYKARSFRLNGRTVTYIRKTKYGRIERLTFKLGDLSTGAMVEQEAFIWRVNVTCARGACISNRITYEGEVEEDRKEGGIILEVYRIDVERVQKALIHAIKLSGGKDELF